MQLQNDSDDAGARAARIFTAGTAVARARVAGFSCTSFIKLEKTILVDVADKAVAFVTKEEFGLPVKMAMDS